MRYACLLVAATAAFAQSVAGLWDARININGVEFPFQLEIKGSGANVQGFFVNGDDREASTSGEFRENILRLGFDDYATELTATLKDNTLNGEWGPYQKRLQVFHAERHVAKSAPTGRVPAIDGVWEMQGVKSSKGEAAWRLIVRQKGDEVSASILRVDGDTGTIAGRFANGKFVLSHFSGARPSLLLIEPASDDTLRVSLGGVRGFNDYQALRPAVARAKGLPEPADPTQHTRVKDSSQPFPFRFPDLNGRVVANTDARFRGKVVLINITGSWCPNCHDEAPFLAELDRKYRPQGLEIVALSFEEAEQLKNPTRLRAFIKKYGLDYTVLLAGETSEAKEKLTNAVNWDAWPTTFFVGRDGLVRSVHAGFASRASGELHTHAKAEFVAQVEKLLAENTSSSRE
jgi:thiol-disulfide isomerase/thioredoxin